MITLSWIFTERDTEGQRSRIEEQKLNSLNGVETMRLFILLEREATDDRRRRQLVPLGSAVSLGSGLALVLPYQRRTSPSRVRR